MSSLGSTLGLTEAPHAGGPVQAPRTAATSSSVALITLRDTLDGPLSTSRQRRLLLIYAVVAISGLVLALRAGPAAQAFGLGLLLPGGGFTLHLGSGIGIAAVAVLGIALTLALFAASLFAWFGSGNILAPIVVWIGAAVLAAALAPQSGWSGAPWLMAAAVAGLAVMTWRRRSRQLSRAVADRDRRNAHLARLAARPLAAQAAAADPAGLPDEALGYLRCVLDRALQPIESFEGFNMLPQFLSASPRYQLCNFGYSLAALQYEHLPAFRGYLSQAQQNVHRKMLDHRIWKYWALENAWGNLSLDPDPVARDNIMYSGWFGAMLAEYVSNTGDGRYDAEPMVLRHPDGREWRYRFTELAEVVYRNFRNSRFTLFPCEPNWIYPMCNNFGAITLKIHDRIHGTRWWSEIEPDYRRQFDAEFTTVDGRTLAIRSSRTGLTIAVLTSVMADCITTYYMHGLFPDMARRAWEIARLDFIKVGEGRVELITRGWDAVDTGNYRKSMITTYAQAGAAAAEMGDREVLELLKQRVRDEFPRNDADGVAVHRGVSNFAYASLLGLFSAGTGVRRRLHSEGMPAETLRGPLLLDAPYPDVLLTRAVNTGGVLDVALSPGHSGAIGHTYALELGQLQPNRRYRCEGSSESEITAGPQGQATVHVPLAPRGTLRVTPAE